MEVKYFNCISNTLAKLVDYGKPPTSPVGITRPVVFLKFPK